MTHGAQAVEPNLHVIDMPFRTPAPEPVGSRPGRPTGGGNMSQQQPPAFGLPADPPYHARTALRLRARGERVIPDQFAANPTTFHDLAAAASARRPAACRPAALAPASGQASRADRMRHRAPHTDRRVARRPPLYLEETLGDEDASRVRAHVRHTGLDRRPARFALCPKRAYAARLSCMTPISSPQPPRRASCRD